MLTISELRVQHGGAEVLHGVDLTVAEGEIVGLIGPNGAGKTTLLLAISGIVRPRSGTILFKGDSVVGPRPADAWNGAPERCPAEAAPAAEAGHLSVAP